MIETTGLGVNITGKDNEKMSWVVVGSTEGAWSKDVYESESTERKRALRISISYKGSNINLWGVETFI